MKVHQTDVYQIRTRRHRTRTCPKRALLCALRQLALPTVQSRWAAAAGGFLEPEKSCLPTVGHRPPASWGPTSVVQLLANTSCVS